MLGAGKVTGTGLIGVGRRLRDRTRPWRRLRMWVPAPEHVVGPREAGIDESTLEMPEALRRFQAPPLFICGSARSGTTWTLDLFTSHPLVYTICESWLLSQGRGLTAVLTQPFWDLPTRTEWERRVDTPFGAVQLVSYEEMVRDVGQLVATWMTNRAADEYRYVVAKEPLDVRATAILFPQARFVHVIRDGRDVALSMRHAAQTWDPSMGPDLSMAARGEAWRRQVQSIRDHAGFLGDRYLEIRYEDMRRDLIAALRRLFDFAGIPYDDALLENVRAATDIARSSEKARQSGFRGGSEHQDRRRMTRREAVGFHRAAGDLLAELGYTQPQSSTAKGAAAGLRAAIARWELRGSQPRQ